jgi:hypothetical protein
MNQHQQYNLQSLRPPSRIHQDEMPTADGDLLLSPALTRIMSPVDSNVVCSRFKDSVTEPEFKQCDKGPLRRKMKQKL